MLDSAVEIIVNAGDEQEALHLLTCENDIQQFYSKTLKYRVDDEFPFYYKMSGFKAASKSKPLPVTPKKDELLLFVNDLKKIVHGLWPDSDIRPPKASRLFEGIASLRAAVELNDLTMIEVYSSHLWDVIFREALAELSGGDLFRVQEFEKFLQSVVCHRRWFNTFSQSSIGWYVGDDRRLEVDSLGLEIVTKYLKPDSYVPLQFPWLSDFLLLMVFDGLIFEAKYSIEQEQPLVRFKTCKDMPILINNLTLLRNEICARHYDAKELVRRLRHMEDVDRSYVMPSLVYPLLELQVRT